MTASRLALGALRRRRAESALAVVVTLLLLVLHVRVFLHAGALWRDEVNTVNLSAAGSLGTLFEGLQYDSYPLLWHLVLRSWQGLGLGGSDVLLRTLGLVVGLGLVAALWLRARWLGSGAPLVSLTMLGTSSAVITYGDSLRAYGLGMILGVLAFGAFRKLLDDPRTRHAVLALLAAVAAVQCLYHNAVLVGACVVAGVVACARRRAWRRCAAFAGIGAAAALSLLPYYAGPIRSAARWVVVVQAPVTARSLAGKAFEALAVSGPLVPWIWGALMLFALAVAVLLQARSHGEDGERRRADRTVFGAVAMLVGGAGYAVFLLVLRFPTTPWYYFVLFVLVASSVETVLSAWSPSGRRGLAPAVALAALLAASLPDAWRAAGLRRTNVDLVAASLQRAGGAGDLVVVEPWYVGLTFHRYYRGATPWTTIPPMSFLSYTRYELVFAEMKDPDGMEPVLRRIRDVLGAGGSVWWVGEPPPAGDRDEAARAEPRPYESADGSYYRRCAARAAEELRAASARPTVVSFGDELPVDGLERAAVVRFRVPRAPR